MYLHVHAYILCVNSVIPCVISKAQVLVLLGHVLLKFIINFYSYRNWVLDACILPLFNVVWGCA